MSTIPHVPISEQPQTEGVNWHLEARDSERIGVLVQILRTMDDAPQSISTKDTELLRQWATRAYVATRRSGPRMMAEAVARLRAQQAAQLALVPDPDAALTQKERLVANRIALAAINAYHQSLEGFRGPISFASGETIAHLEREVRGELWTRAIYTDRGEVVTEHVCPKHRLGYLRELDARLLSGQALDLPLHERPEPRVVTMTAAQVPPTQHCVVCAVL